MVVRGKLLILGVLSLLALLALGCGSDSDKKSDTSSAGSNGRQAQSSDCAGQAQKVVDGARQEAELELGGPFEMAKNSGKTVWVINAVRTPILQQISDASKKAAEAAGMNAKVVYADGTTNSQQTAIQQAVAQKAGGIVLIVIDPATVKPAIAAAKRAKIPVIDVSNRSAGDPVPDGLAGQSAAALADGGKALAAWIMADSGCKANVLLYRASAFPIHVILTENAQAEFKRLCPDCKVEVKEIDLATFSNTMTAEVQTDLRRSPDTNYVFPVLDAAVPFVDAALRGQSNDIKVVSHDGVLENLDAMRKGDTAQAADMSFIPAAPWGWSLIDQIGRLMAGEEASEVVIPTRLIDETNIGADNDALWPAFRDHEATYKKSWGAG